VHKVSWALCDGGDISQFDCTFCRFRSNFLMNLKSYEKKTSPGISDFEKFRPSVTYLMSEVEFFSLPKTSVLLKLRINISMNFVRK